MTGTFQPAQVAGVLLDDRVDARVLEPDRVEHPARRLGHARRRVADARLERRALAADRAEPVDVDDVAVLDAVAERPRRDEDRVRQDEAAAEVDRQVDVAAGGDRPTAARDGAAAAAATAGARRRRRRSARPGAGAPSGVRFAPAGRPRRSRRGAWPSPGRLPGELLGGEHRALAADPLRRRRSRSCTTQPRHAPTAQPMFCSIDTWRNAFRRAAGEPGRIGLARRRASARAWRRPSRSRRPAASRASAREHRRPARRRTPGRPTPRTRRRGRSRSRGGRASRRRSRRRTRPRRAAGSTGRPRARDAAPNRSVTWRPSRIASSASIRTPAMPEPAGDQQQVRGSAGRPRTAARAARACRPRRPAAAG